MFSLPIMTKYTHFKEFKVCFVLNNDTSLGPAQLFTLHCLPLCAVSFYYAKAVAQSHCLSVLLLNKTTHTITNEQAL